MNTLTRRSWFVATAMAVLGIAIKPRRRPTHETTESWTFVCGGWQQAERGRLTIGPGVLVSTGGRIVFSTPKEAA